MNTPQTAMDEELRRIDEAERWMTVLRENPADEHTLASWLQWSADPANLQEFERLQQIWCGVGQLEASRSQLARADRVRRPGLSMALAAGVLLAVGAVAWLTLRDTGLNVRSYDTAVAVTSNIPLADGSRVQLGPVSRINAHLTDAARIIRLEAGEAYFDVAQDPLRPFIVDVGGVKVTAIGTAFNVHKGDGHVQVTVTEGAVRVVAPTGSPVEAGAGQQVRYVETDSRLSVREADVAVATAWRSGVLKFVDEPLRNVVADLNRYSERRIVIEADALAALPYTGTVFAGRLDQWLVALQDAFPLQVEEEGRQRVTLRMK